MRLLRSRGKPSSVSGENELKVHPQRRHLLEQPVSGENELKVLLQCALDPGPGEYQARMS